MSFTSSPWFNSPWIRAVALVLAAVPLLAGAFLVLVQVSPWYVGLNDDSGLFAYGGQRILQGDLLYRDLWDTKPPGVFYLNAVALALGGPTPWAIWWFQFAWIGLAAIVLLIVLSRLSGMVAGTLSSGLFLFTALYPGYFQGGNLSEVYALLPQALTVASAGLYFRTGRSGWLVATGVATGLAFLLKPTYVALGAAAVLLAAGQAFQAGGNRQALRTMVAPAVGFLVPVALVGVYWGWQGALGELWEAVFRHNLGYVREGLSLRSLYGTARAFLVEPPLVALTALSVAGLAKYLPERRPRRGASAGKLLPGFGAGAETADRGTWRRSVFALAFLALPLEVAFVALSGRNFGHYFLTPLLAMAVAIAYLLKDVLPLAARPPSLSHWQAISAAMVGVLLLAWGLEVGPRELPERAHLGDLARRSLSGEYWTDALEQYVAVHTSASDSVLVWGYNPGLHFLTGRRAPSRYLFHAQLFTPTVAAERRFDRFLQDLEADPPALILAQPESPHAIPFFAAQGEAFCPECTPAAREQLAELRDLVERYYVLAEEIEGWVVFRLRPKGA